MDTYPNITIQFEDFDERYDVVEGLKPYLYKWIAAFRDKADAEAFAKIKADVMKLNILDKCPRKRAVPRKRRAAQEE